MPVFRHLRRFLVGHSITSSSRRVQRSICSFEEPCDWPTEQKAAATSKVAVVRAYDEAAEARAAAEAEWMRAETARNLAAEYAETSRKEAQQVTLWRQELQALRAQCAEAERQARAHRADVDELFEKDKAANRKRIAQQTEALLKNQQTALKDGERAKADLNAQLAAQVAVRKKVQSETAKLQKEYEKVIKQRDEAQRQLTNAQQQLSATMKHQNAVKKAIEKAEAELDVCRAARDSATAETAQVKTECEKEQAAARRQLTESRHNVTVVKKAIDTLQREVAHLESAKAQLRAETNAVEDALAEREREAIAASIRHRFDRERRESEIDDLLAEQHCRQTVIHCLLSQYTQLAAAVSRLEANLRLLQVAAQQTSLEMMKSELSPQRAPLCG